MLLKRNVKKSMLWNTENEQKCLHRGCSDCDGTGTKKNGQQCIHMISCPCRRCTPYRL